MMPTARLMLLAARVHQLGPRPLFELFREFDAGADFRTRVERYATLDPVFVRQIGGDELPPPIRLIGER
jgi:hypothetical protein